MEIFRAQIHTANSSSRTFVLCGYRIGGTMAHAVADALAPADSLTPSKEREQNSDRSQRSTVPSVAIVSVAFGAPQGIASGSPNKVIGLSLTGFNKSFIPS